MILYILMPELLWISFLLAGFGFLLMGFFEIKSKTTDNTKAGLLIGLCLVMFFSACKLSNT